jgi:hypothetical protein
MNLVADADAGAATKGQAVQVEGSTVPAAAKRRAAAQGLRLFGGSWLLGPDPAERPSASALNVEAIYSGMAVVNFTRFLTKLAS